MPRAKARATSAAPHQIAAIAVLTTTQTHLLGRHGKTGELGPEAVYRPAFQALRCRPGVDDLRAVHDRTLSDLDELAGKDNALQGCFCASAGVFGVGVRGTGAPRLVDLGGSRQASALVLLTRRET